MPEARVLVIGAADQAAATLASVQSQEGVDLEIVAVPSHEAADAADPSLQIRIAAGDVLLPGAARRLIDAALASPHAGAVHGRTLRLRADGTITRRAFHAQRSSSTNVVPDGVHLIRRGAGASAVVELRAFLSARRDAAGIVPPAMSGVRPRPRLRRRSLLRRAGAFWDLIWPAFAWWPLTGERRTTRAVQPRVGYYTWQFPTLSQTFVHRELAALVAAGLDVRIVADQRGQTTGLDADARSLLTRTRYLSSANRVTTNGKRLLRRHPVRALNVLMYLLTHRHGPRKSAADDGALFRHVIEVAAAIEDEGITHVHAPWADRTALVGLAAARMLRLPFSFQARAHDIHRGSYRVGLADKLGHADVVVTNSAYNHEHLAPLMGRRRPRLVTIYNGIDLTKFLPPTRRDPNARLTLLCVARLIEQKGIDDLLQACRRLDERGRDFSCDIVGAAETPLYTAFAVRLMERFASLGLERRVTFHGAEPFDRILTRYANADIFVLPCVIADDGSRDIIPNAVIEAMAMQMPVVSTAITGLPEIIDDGVSGLLVPPRDPNALATALERLMDDEDLRKRLGDAARRRVEARFDLQRNAMTRVALFHGPPATPVSADARS